ncbi:hypothetical protein ACCO45_001057 [Purpureocillium lilacinum]|uniref:Uncharacterized protein n=1 Tax=Purpureocillium lilacinum TaxID=33203 RepID=A0ACC4E752_PURLI
MVLVPGYVEFYVTCNPPLLPGGVSSVVQATQAAHPEGQVLEILYEPDVPWFKIITEQVHQQKVTHFVQKQLLAIVEQDAGLVDPEQRKQEEPSQAAFADVAILANSPVSSRGRALRHQTTWRGLEERGWDFPAFFDILETHWKHAGAPASILGLETLTRCQVTHNMAGSLAYVGTDFDQATLDKAISTLDNLVCVAVAGGRDAKHLIVTEGKGPVRFALNWLSHIGQERTTFVHCDTADLSTEYQRLQDAVRVRAKFKEHNAWNPKHPTSVHVLLKRIPDATEPETVDQDHAAVEDTERPSTQSHITSPGSTALASDNVPLNAVESWRDEVVRLPQDHIEQPWGRADSPEKLIQMNESCIDENPITCQPSGLLLDTLESVQAEAQTIVKNEPDHFDEDLICLDPEETKPPSRVDGDEDLLDFRELPSTEGRSVNYQPDPFSALGCTLLDEGRTESLSRHQVLVPASVSSRNHTVAGKSNGPGDLHVDLHRHESREGGQNESRDARGKRRTLSSAQHCQGTATSKTTFSTATSASLYEQLSDRPRVSMTGASTEGAKEGRRLQVVESGITQRRNGEERDPGAGGSAAQVYGGRAATGPRTLDFGSGPFYSAAELSDILHDMDPASLGFSSALTTFGPDMERVVQARPPGEAAWRHLGTHVFYDFHCRDDSDTEFVVEVDAETFEFTCRGATKELRKLYLHGASRAWDMQVCASRAANLDSSTRYRAIGRAIVASICVKSVGGEVALEAIRDERLRAVITDIRVRHVAKYRQGERGRSELSIIMMKRMNLSQWRDRRANWVAGSPGQDGYPVTSYEASITSLRAKELLMENQNMTIGQRASWDCDLLEAEGVFEAICWPALSMIASMDEIGTLNDNGQRLTAQRSFNDTTAGGSQRRGKTVFW